MESRSHRISRKRDFIDLTETISTQDIDSPKLKKIDAKETEPSEPKQKISKSIATSTKSRKGKHKYLPPVALDRIGLKHIMNSSCIPAETTHPSSSTPTRSSSFIAASHTPEETSIAVRKAQMEEDEKYLFLF
jgi:hypothetical protein